MGEEGDGGIGEEEEGGVGRGEGRDRADDVI